MTASNTWETLVKKAIDTRDKSLALIDPPLLPIPANLPLDLTGIPAKVLSAEEVEITESHDATSLAIAIASKKYTAETVIKAFLRRAAVAQQLVSFFYRPAEQQVNCVTELLPETAI